jgi:hypothetical protein
MNSLEFEKIILEKLSFNQNLFEKELKKALNRLGPEDCMELQEWCREHFSPAETKKLQTKVLLQENH